MFQQQILIELIVYPKWTVCYHLPTLMCQTWM